MVKTTMKWFLIVAGGLFVIIIAAILIVPRFVNVQRFKPDIEKRVSDATGRPFRLGGDLSLSLFPWVGLSLSDVHLGNPPGFEEKDLVAIKSFEVRVRLLPLLSKDIQVKRFILDTPRIVLEKTKDGRGNWEGIGKPPEQAPAEGDRERREAAEREPLEGLPIKSLAVGECLIKDASLLYIDQVTGDRKDLSDMTLRLKDVSLDRPIRLALFGKVVGHPLSLEGEFGPLGRDLGKGSVPFNLALRLATELHMSLAGKLVDAPTQPQFDLAFDASPFSPKKLLAALGQAFPVETADSEALSAVAFKANVRGDPQKISVSDGLLTLDESRLTFSAKAKDYASKPDVTFDVNLDEIDLDRYLPPSAERESRELEKTAAPGKPEPRQADYAPLRELVLDGSFRVGKLKAYGAWIQDLSLKVSGKDGQFHLEPLTLRLYEGQVSAKGTLDVRQDVPRTQAALNAGGIQVGPLLQDVLSQDLLEGIVQAKVSIAMTGDDAQGIKKTLNGEGDFLLKDGAIKGLDLAGMVRNVEAAFGLAKAEEKPRTDFSELHAPFTITNGVVKTPGTTLTSPALRVLAAGEADLAKETVNFRVEPKFVATLKGQGDAMERAGFMVPVLVTGSLAAPKFRPDLEGMIRKGLQEKMPQPSELIEMLPGQTKGEDDSGALEEKAKDLLKQIPLGR